MFQFNFFDAAPAASSTTAPLPVAAGLGVRIVPPPPPPPLAAAAVATAPYAHGLVRALVDADSVSGCARDVVASVYEGGAKLWECTRDVLDWLSSSPDAAAAACRARLVHGTVLDLGCGTALLACYCARRGAGAVVCQDLNADVLARVSAANLSLNGVGGGAPGGGAAAGACRVTLLAGAWSDIAAGLDAAPGLDAEAAGPAAAEAAGGGGGGGGSSGWRACLSGTCELVVASEILYREEHYAALVAILAHALAPAGAALIGSKRIYFGAELGGGTHAFVAHVNAPRGAARGLRARVVLSIEDGKSMTRDLVLVERVAA